MYTICIYCKCWYVLYVVYYIVTFILQYYTNMDLWWGQYGVLCFWGKNSCQYCCRRSIKPILPNIIGQYKLYYMSNVCGWCPLVYGYIYCYIVFNNLLPFPVLQFGAWCYYSNITLSYYDLRYHESTSQQYQAVREMWMEGHSQLGLGSTRVTFLSNNSTIWHHNSTIWHHNSSTMTRGQYWKILSGQYGILSQYATLLKVMWPIIN